MTQKDKLIDFLANNIPIERWTIDSENFNNFYCTVNDIKIIISLFNPNVAVASVGSKVGIVFKKSLEVRILDKSFYYDYKGVAENLYKCVLEQQEIKDEEFIENTISEILKKLNP